MSTTGMDLRVLRVRARLTVRDVAKELGCSRQWLWQAYESPAEVDATRALEYRAAVAKLLDDKGRAK